MSIFDDFTDEKVLDKLGKDDLVKLAFALGHKGGIRVLYNRAKMGTEAFTVVDSKVFEEALVALGNTKKWKESNKRTLKKIIKEQGQRLKLTMNTELDKLIGRFFEANPSGELVTATIADLSLFRAIFVAKRDNSVPAGDQLALFGGINTKARTEPQEIGPQVREQQTAVTHDESESETEDVESSDGANVRSVLVESSLPARHSNADGQRNQMGAVMNAVGPFNMLPPFNGRSREGVEEWFMKVENVARLCRVTEIEILPLILHKLSGNAFQIASNMLSNNDYKVDWIEFKGRFFDSCSEDDHQFRLRNQII